MQEIAADRMDMLFEMIQGQDDKPDYYEKLKTSIDEKITLYTSLIREN
ncbi:hypothetical protein SAMN02745945_01981 [Peptoclostridium litorale DSM 5388]|uniref:Uncharacterized protein n=1 Tax=Peptoclostridium litorale DSM 5388 TaxID=1121324 RepID=A0A069RJC5_PEPLI|nr:hypothetical protein [Peptoclostridium litorale]KDR96250.1 hypothetical protein CLIT_4c00870 [Peptoclostridium litorale DSM 5388]SIO14474.1 hypothetical protein SAMN02745945_01981 [Peptoclostridium litorale DSM 5388]